MDPSTWRQNTWHFPWAGRTIGFVCSPRHHTFSNIERDGDFTVSYPKPSQVLYASLAASPRYAGGPKTVLQGFATFPAKKIDGEFIEDAYLFLECKHYKTVDGFGDNCLQDCRRLRR
jgi:flavin reductase (DIM6/NTAB) family NADH-FMN oxidoreductase RutF